MIVFGDGRPPDEISSVPSTKDSVDRKSPTRMSLFDPSADRPDEDYGSGGLTSRSIVFSLSISKRSSTFSGTARR